MASEIKTLKFYEGLEVGAPDQEQPITTGPSTLANHAIRKSEAEAYADSVSGASGAAALAAANAYTDAEIAALIDNAPAALDTLNELAAALGDDANFSTTVLTALANRLRVDTAAQGLTAPEKTNAKTNIDLQNVDNTSDSSKNSAAVTLTNKTLDGFKLVEQVDAASTGPNATMVTPVSPVIKLTNASLVSIDMIPAVAGMFLILENKTGVALTVNNLLGGTPANQIETGTGANLSFGIDATIILYYSPTVLKWKVVGGSGGGSSASAGVNLQWRKGSSPAPLTSYVDGMDVEDFSNEESQELYATIKVPDSYAGGSLISLRGLSFFTSLITGNVFFKTQSSLIRAGTTAIGTYTNQRTSTNAQVAVSGTTLVVKDVGNLDITDNAGAINSVPVLAGDKIRIRLYRDIASETSGLVESARLILDAAEIKL